ncbi:uncharacterized protein LOC128957705 isoform X2 [Oppia nitens]|uniref:uncharacterized protein LOC128957705 isoform X2 n=1 Tax=Oppia nitens TaxID=1686743 RepID=UPI0023DC5F13|nr:uncharacterized protein LOC128957705 isoform X2 [Oppia nitens]
MSIPMMNIDSDNIPDQQSSAEQMARLAEDCGRNVDNNNQQRVYTIADLGLRSTPHTQQTIIGPTRSLYTLSGYEWIYLALSALTLAIMLGITIDRLIELPSNEPDFTFAFLLFWTTCFCCVYVCQGVFRERAFELIAFVATILIVWVYVIFNYSASASHTTIKIVRLVITSIFAPLLISGGLYFSSQYFKSKNLIYRTVGANISMQRMCELLFLAQSLVKFDVQLAGSTLILWLRKGFRHWDQMDKIVISIGTGITIAWILLASMAYSQDSTDDLALEMSVYLSGCIAIVIRIVTLIVMMFVMFNFDKGLRNKVYGSDESIPQSDNTNNQSFD